MMNFRWKMDADYIKSDDDDHKNVVIDLEPHECKERISNGGNENRDNERNEALI